MAGFVAAGYALPFYLISIPFNITISIGFRLPIRLNDAISFWPSCAIPGIARRRTVPEFSLVSLAAGRYLSQSSMRWRSPTMKIKEKTPMAATQPTNIMAPTKAP